MGTVFRAWDPQIRRIVAVKVLGVRPGILAEDVERFAREAHAAGRLRHPGVIAIHDVGHHEQDPFIVMDFVAGTTLRALLVERRPARQVLSLVREVALALDHAHARGVVHRDVKPANVLIDEDGRPILTDFGLAGDSSARDRLTTTGSTLGTPAYMSPEQVEGHPERVGPPTDVWALGVILYEATCGRAPYFGPSVTDVFAKILLDEPEPPRRVAPDMAPELEALIMRCLARDPARRPTARGLASAIDALLARSGELAPARSRPRSARPRRF